MSRPTHRPFLFVLAALLAGCTGEPADHTTTASRAVLDDPEDPLVEAIAVAYYTEKHRVSEDEARQRLALQDRATGLDDDLAALLGADDAGMWFDPDDRGRLKIGVTRTGAARGDEIRKLVGEYALDRDVDLVGVRFSLADLTRIQDGVRDRLSTMMTRGHARTGYNPRENAVRVTALVQLPADEEKLVRAIASTPGVVIRRVDAPTLLVDPQSCGVNACDPPLRGGRALASSSVMCTGAFIGHTKGTPSRYLMLTAGHCIFFNATYYGNGYGDIWTAKTDADVWHSIGAMYDSAFPAKDAGAITIAPTSFWADPTPIPAIVVKHSAYSDINTKYPIKRIASSVLGQVLCRTGLTTATHCAEVSDLGDDITIDGPDDNTYTLKNLGELDMCDAQGGDSGGPVFRHYGGYGIHMGHVTGGGHCYEFYQGIRGAVQALDVNVVVAP